VMTSSPGLRSKDSKAMNKPAVAEVQHWALGAWK